MYDYSMQFVNTSSSRNFSVASYQGGPFLAQLFSLFTMITNNKPLNAVPVLSIHATHDTTIKPILNFFGLVGNHVCCFATLSVPFVAETNFFFFLLRTTAALPASLLGPRTLLHLSRLVLRSPPSCAFPGTAP
jgi:hypothetical protein